MRHWYIFTKIIIMMEYVRKRELRNIENHGGILMRVYMPNLFRSVN
jgi:hypothetical protein